MLDHFKHIGYVGVDISRGMLQQAQHRLIGCPSLIVGAGERLPFDDDTFAAAYISGSLHHFRDPGKGFSEIVRVIRPGGRLVVMEPYWLFPTNIFYALISSEERGILSISESGMARWSAGTGLINVKLGHMLYTPPVPHALGGAYDVIDSILANIPLVRKASVMLYLYGEKGHMSEGVMRNEG
jgi:SAM-dependent methyltransferase